MRFVGGRGGGGGSSPKCFDLQFPLRNSTLCGPGCVDFEVVPVRFRHWPHLTEVCDGVCTVIMVHTRAIPRDLIIDGFPSGSGTALSDVSGSCALMRMLMHCLMWPEVLMVPAP